MLQCFVVQVWIKKMSLKLIFPINISYYIRLYQPDSHFKLLKSCIANGSSRYSYFLFPL